MSIIVEFTIDKEDLALGRALAGAGDVHIELEKIIPAGDTLIPFFWVSDPDEKGLDVSATESKHVKNLVLLDTLGSHALYKVEWTGEYEDLLAGIVETEGTILEATGTKTWHFVLRFLDHDHVGQFYNYCTDHGIPVHIDRVYTLTEEALRGRMFKLTNEQREAIVLALDRGYFSIPREVQMRALADELGISQQAFSERLWRGLEKVLANLFR
ncbi:helix-turn-helix domain-containing protein [Haladaptatus salinisoli]|uniref:helix-turn-helix domain-containing protein n=1 Tax=Haladaptatus salinisoli TaxID=2884876 RepID=UPI001D09AB38|nr:helix-turn-helix domain-containing protein [Haladaptatus salinisoli]